MKMICSATLFFLKMSFLKNWNRLLTCSVHFSFFLCTFSAFLFNNGSGEEKKKKEDNSERLEEQRSSPLHNKLHLSVWSSFLHSCCKYYSTVGRIQWIMMYQVYMHSATGVWSESHSPWNPCYWSLCKLQNKCIYTAVILCSSKRFWYVMLRFFPPTCNSEVLGCLTSFRQNTWYYASFDTWHWRKLSMCRFWC